MSNQIIISRKFAEKLSSLSRQIQKGVNGIYNKLAKNAEGAGLNLESIQGAASPSMKSVRVNDNYRIVLHRDSKGTFTFLHIDTHDAAYAWAGRNKFEVNPYTGEVQLYVVDIPEVRVDGLSPATHGVQKDAATAAVPGPFANAPSDEDLKRIGVPESQIPLVRSLKDDEDILAHEEGFSQGVFDALLLAYDGKNADEIIKELDIASKGANIDDVAKAVVSSDASQANFAFASSEEELNEIRKAALEKWRIFLHPSQRKIVKKNAKGPMKVLGGAGTGKTVVAMHRARYLLENIFTASSERLLFTTFTKNLCDDIGALLKTICSDSIMSRIDVRNLDAWALEYVRSLRIDVHPLVEEKDKTALMEEAMALVEGSDVFKAAFYLRERSLVVLPNGIDSIGAYLKASRAGLGVRLSAAQKRIVWQVQEAYRAILSSKAMMDFDEIAIMAANEIKARGNVPYVSVIVDEAQDFSSPALRLVAALSGNTREAPRPNSLLVVGDAHQRIYGKKASLGKCGINVMGRSSKLKINYRTTEKIRKRAVALLEGVSVDDLDGATDDNKGFRSLVVGVAPNEARFNSFTKEMDAFVEAILGWMQADGREAADYAILARRKTDVKAIKEALRERGVKCCEVKKEMTVRETDKDAIRIATMHRAKGLEFAGVVLAEVNDGIWPLRPKGYEYLDPVAKKIVEDSERSLLYVALSRAINHAMITGIGVAPGELSC